MNLPIKKIFSLGILIFGLICFGFGFKSILNACQNLGNLAVLPDLFSGMVLITIFAIIFAPLLSERLAWAFHNFLFPVPEIKRVASLGKAQALVLKRDYEGAIQDLEDKLIDYPDQKNLLTLLYQIKYEKCELADEVLNAIRKEIFHHPWDSEYEKMTMIAVDIFLENMDVDGSQLFLRNVLERCDDSHAYTRIAMRLHTFQDYQNRGV